jgi:hypothetical protein
MAALLLAAADPLPADFVIASEYAAATLSAGGPAARSAPRHTDSRERRPMTLAEYRRLRAGCALNRLSRLGNRAEISVEWLCGPLGARWNDAYAIVDGRVAEVQVNVVVIQIPAVRPAVR